MAILIPIARTELTETAARYRYSQPIQEEYEHRPNKRRSKIVGHNTGEVEINRNTGELRWISGQDWDTEQFFYLRVASSLMKAYQTNEYPETLTYAA